MNTPDLLQERLELIYRWYQAMVNPATEMFEYLYIPQRDAFVAERSPIRDIATVWDAENLSRFLNRHELDACTGKSLQYYRDCLAERDGYTILDPERLREPSSIAHSAFLILALLDGPGAGGAREIPALADGILRQQRPNGSYKVYFHDLPDHGEELYAGEAMLALIECHRRQKTERYLQSVERAFSYYANEYFGKGRVAEDVLVFFANWQSQACRRLSECATNSALSAEVAGFLHRMHDRIIDEGFYESVERHPARQVSVAVACALEGLNDTYTLAGSRGDRRAQRYRRAICIGLDYLLDLQCTKNGTDTERGGFGMTLNERMQRIDVTGHAASALMKSVENGIECAHQSADVGR